MEPNLYWGVPDGWGVLPKIPQQGGAIFWYISHMDFDSSDNSDAHFTGKIKSQTFKQFQLERLIKEGKVIPASQLAKSIEQELKRVRDFQAASADEERHRRTATVAPSNKLDTLPLTRERFNE